VQRYQGEAARADAERARALTEEQTNRRVLRSRLRAVKDELREVRRALDVLAGEAEPAAAAAVEAAIDMQRAGKSDLFPVLTSRREVGLLRLRELDLVLREWTLASELAQITGRFG
jgi:50S ribosomal subunit-associated GTPase HflX